METSASCEARYAPLLYPTKVIGEGSRASIAAILVRQQVQQRQEDTVDPC
jgi:hypothetical protein